MSEITNQQRDERYEKGSEVQKHLYASPASGNQLWKIAEKHQLTADKTYTDFVIAVGDIVLGFYTPVQLPQLLTEKLQMDPKSALAVTADVLDFLAPLTSGEVPQNQPTPKIPTVIPPAQNSTPKIPEVQTIKDTNKPINNNVLAADIAETEAALNSTSHPPTLRTMADDMRHQKESSDIPTYTTTQAAILRESKTSDEARWGQN